VSRALALRRTLAPPLFAVALAVGAAALLSALAGENPLHVLGILARSAFGSTFGLGYTLYYATPFLLAGLAVALPYRAGLFNIGGEGQLLLGAAAAAAVGVSFPGLPALLAIPLGVLVAAAAGAAWGVIPGWLKARRGSHEVIVTILLNIVAAALVNWIILHLLKEPASQVPESKVIGEGFRLSWRLVAGTPANATLLLAAGLAVLAHFLLNRTVLGFEIRAVGAGREAARAQGISDARTWLLVMAIGGACAGLVGVNEVMGQAYRLKDGFSPGFGFTGIAVALLGRGHPLGVIPAALFFGALHRGASELDIDTENVSRDLALVLQAVIILVVAGQAAWRGRGRGAS
jgi:ABC-type uncharacterized transport system permease subunit